MIDDDIEKEENIKEEKIKKIFKITLFIIIPVIIFMLISFIILKYIGNSGIIVREYAIYNNNLPEDFNGLKIVQFSDLHYNDNSSISKLEKIVEMINKTNPDIVVFTGDLIDTKYIIDDNTLELIQNNLKNINSKLGKYAIKGEEDNTYFTQVFDNSNFKILDNELEKIYLNNSYINLLSVNDTYLKDNINGIIENDFLIVLTHMPDLSDRIISDFSPNIIMSGHSHNGQVRLPLIGPLMRKIGAKKYPNSHYTINNTELYVSGGLGNSKYDFRLFNHPSINFYRLRTSK